MPERSSNLDMPERSSNLDGERSPQVKSSQVKSSLLFMYRLDLTRNPRPGVQFGFYS